MVGGTRGFTYLAVLFMLAIMAGGLALIGEMWETSLRRDKEADLVHVGNAYRRAIMLYYEGPPGGLRRFPRELADLVKDDRYPGTRRYLHKVYPDPVTGGEWALMRAPDGGIMGVYSTAKQTPLRTGVFRLADRGLAGASSYADWKFFYQPTPVVVPSTPGAAAAPAAAAAPR
jgi:type II secretory pathway pseudopilin PulG